MSAELLSATRLPLLASSAADPAPLFTGSGGSASSRLPVTPPETMRWDEQPGAQGGTLQWGAAQPPKLDGGSLESPHATVKPLRKSGSLKKGVMSTLRRIGSPRSSKSDLSRADDGSGYAS
jgi:hypothetical protein